MSEQIADDLELEYLINLADKYGFGVCCPWPQQQPLSEEDELRGFFDDLANSFVEQRKELDA